MTIGVERASTGDLGRRSRSAGRARDRSVPRRRRRARPLRRHHMAPARGPARLRTAAGRRCQCGAGGPGRHRGDRSARGRRERLVVDTPAGDVRRVAQHVRRRRAARSGRGTLVDHRVRVMGPRSWLRRGASSRAWRVGWPCDPSSPEQPPRDCCPHGDRDQPHHGLEHDVIARPVRSAQGHQNIAGGLIRESAARCVIDQLVTDRCSNDRERGARGDRDDHSLTDVHRVIFAGRPNVGLV
ncbi:MAG: hypothetical protein JWN99_630 [Ilumatobacteraceae bacterium]|nr:hypothetical protein [Ilumatobacteraceae bacterium]